MSEQKKIMIIQKFPLELKNMVTQIIEEGFVVDSIERVSPFFGGRTPEGRYEHFADYLIIYSKAK